jgi:hypothetical protein
MDHGSRDQGGAEHGENGESSSEKACVHGIKSFLTPDRGESGPYYYHHINIMREKCVFNCGGGLFGAFFGSRHLLKRIVNAGTGNRTGQA